MALSLHVRDRVRPVVLWLTLPLGLLAVGLSAPAILLSEWYEVYFSLTPRVMRAFTAEGVPALISSFRCVLAAGVFLFLAGHILGMIRRPWALRLIRCCLGFALFVGLFYNYVVVTLSGIIFARELSFAGVEKYDRVLLFHLQWHWSWPVLAVMGVLALIYLVSWRSRALAVYTGRRDDSPTPGDMVVENLRTHGRDPVFRKSVHTSILSHLLIIVILPWLLQMIGCVTPYRVPKGKGNPVVAMVAVTKPKKEKKKQYILNPDSMVLFKVPEINDSEIFNQVVEATEVTYTAQANAKAGKMGVGDGKKGGWPDGMENHLVRFIRLKYNGANWDDGMDEESGADRNFLERFHKLTGFKVERNGEAHAIRLLAKYPKGYAPPFVYMTGSSSIRVSARERKILRAYLLDGGMLIGDAGSQVWSAGFLRFIRSVLPDKELLVVADDDPLFQMPYQFPNGAPALWHHGGNHAMGVKHRGRWVVFFHPGDMNDAWKTGRSGLDPKMAEGAYQMGVNLVYYAFTHYLEETRKYRK